jgi:hypothetical protein
MAKPFSALTDKMDPERVNRVIAKVDAMLKHGSAELASLPPAYKDFIPVFDVLGTPGFCIFCYAHKNDAKETSCNYGGRHEITAEPAKKQEKVVDKRRCKLCDVHKSNPLYATNGCEHKHEE